MVSDNKITEAKILEEIEEKSSKAGPERLDEVILKEEIMDMARTPILRMLEISKNL